MYVSLTVKKKTVVFDITGEEGVSSSCSKACRAAAARCIEELAARRIEQL